MTWLLRRLPHDPSTMPAALAELVVTLIDKNNAALANDLARRDPPRDEPADY